MAMSSFSHHPHRLLLDTESNPPLEPYSNGPYVNEANFDKNMVIILTALFCALICALGLNLIVRCAIQCSRRFSLGAGDRAATRTAATGLKKSALLQIPVSVYRPGVGILMATSTTDCPICLGEFEDGEKVRVLPGCHHGFHVGCIDTWLVTHSSCPTCRQSLLEPNTSCAVSDAADNLSVELPATANSSEIG